MLAGCLIASAWFIGHLLLVYRAVGTVQVRRNVANLEFREALTPGTLLTVAVATGALLGLLVGVGASGWWREVDARLAGRLIPRERSAPGPRPRRLRGAASRSGGPPTASSSCWFSWR